MPAASAPSAPLASSTTLYQARLHVRLLSDTNPQETNPKKKQPWRGKRRGQIAVGRKGPSFPQVRIKRFKQGVPFSFSCQKPHHQGKSGQHGHIVCGGRVAGFRRAIMSKEPP